MNEKYPGYLDDITRYNMLEQAVKNNPRIFCTTKIKLLFNEKINIGTQVYIGKDATHDDLQLAADLMHLGWKIRMLMRTSKSYSWPNSNRRYLKVDLTND